MGLDVYVGSLTRYFLHQWETVIQKYARENGLTCEIVRPPGCKLEDPPPEPASVRESVIAWRDSLAQGLSSHPIEFPEWDESDASPYFTDKPAWDCYACLLMKAAYDEHPELRCPEKSTDDWDKDPAWLASTADGYRTGYAQLLFPELWLPWSFNFVFQAQDLSGTKVWIGSSPKLLEQLSALNKRAFHAGEDQFRAWRAAGSEYGGPFDIAAQFGFAILWELASQAVLHNLPIKLDY